MAAKITESQTQTRKKFAPGEGGFGHDNLPGLECENVHGDCLARRAGMPGTATRFLW